ncbi:MAG: DNA-binding protein [Pseudomonadota bacterium]
MEYQFTLKYQLAEEDCEHNAIVERLGEAGCDDALIGLGQPGRIALEFMRDAPSAEAAVISALADVKQAIPTAKLVEATPDLVGITDVADLVGVSRQYMRKLIMSNAMSFPTPAHEGMGTVWHLANVVDWLNAKGSYTVDAKLADTAMATMQVNIAKEATQMQSQTQQALQGLVA